MRKRKKKIENRCFVQRKQRFFLISSYFNTGKAHQVHIRLGGFCLALGDGQVLNGVDVVVGRGRDQGHAGGGAAGAALWLLGFAKETKGIKGSLV